MCNINDIQTLLSTFKPFTRVTVSLCTPVPPPECSDCHSPLLHPTINCHSIYSTSIVRAEHVTKIKCYVRLLDSRVKLITSSLEVQMTYK